MFATDLFVDTLLFISWKSIKIVSTNVTRWSPTFYFNHVRPNAKQIQLLPCFLTFLMRLPRATCNNVIRNSNICFSVHVLGSKVFLSFDCTVYWQWSLQFTKCSLFFVIVYIIKKQHLILKLLIAVYCSYID